MQAGFTYKGYRYEPYEDVEPEECVKIWHEVVTPTGEKISMSWSPYSTPLVCDFQLWIDLGCPGSIGNGNLDSKDLQKIKVGMAEGMNGRELVKLAASFAGKELPGSNWYQLERLAQEILVGHEFFDGEPTSPTWFAAQVVKRYREIERAASR